MRLRVHNKTVMNKSHSKFRLWFDRLLSKSIWEQFAVLGGVLAVLFVLSWVFLSISGCDWDSFANESEAPEWLLPIYLLIDTNAFNNLYINGVRGWALVISSLTYLSGLFIFNGAIIGIIVNSIDQRTSNYREGRTHYLKSGHYIIMGYDDMVPSIISHIFEKDCSAYVLLLSSAESELLREKLKKVFDDDKLKQIIINYGHRNSTGYYKDIHLETAEQVYIVGNRSNQSHDAINVECVDSICTYLEQPPVVSRPKRITCVFEDLDTYAAFKTSEIFGRVKDLRIEFVPYNFYSGWAKQVFVKQSHKDMDHPGKDIKYPAVYGKDIADPECTKYAHLVFVGTTNFAVAFAMEAANVLHFPNGEKVKTLITFIDKNADEEKAEFIIRNRHFFEIQKYHYYDLSDGKDKEKEKQGVRDEFVIFNGNDANFLDVEFKFIKGDVFSKPVQDLIGGWAQEHNRKQYLSIFLAMANQRQNFVMGMNMPESIYTEEVPLFIRQDRSDNFVSNLRSADLKVRGEKKGSTYYFLNKENKVEEKGNLGGRYANIYPFGMNETAYSADEKSLERAKLINYLYSTMLPPDYNKFQSLLVLSAIPDEKIRSEADGYWRGLSVALKWSNLYNAYSLRIKLAMLRCMRGLKMDDNSMDTKPLSDEEVDILARLEHNRWNVEKLLMGFRKAHKDEDKYEAKAESKAKLKKNKDRFIHHDIRPYDQLDAVKELDKEFSRYIPWIMEMTQ